MNYIILSVNILCIKNVNNKIFKYWSNICYVERSLKNLKKRKIFESGVINKNDIISQKL